MDQPSDPITAAILVIGDEILSGRTKDKNIGTIADFLTAAGIDLREVRIVPDEAAMIVEAVNAPDLGHLGRRLDGLDVDGDAAHPEPGCKACERLASAAEPHDAHR